MSANTFVQSAESTELAEHAYGQFLQELSEAAPRLGNLDVDVYMWCHLAPPGEESRRILVVADRHSPIVRVCIEAAYALFAGDIHHYVKRIGTVTRAEIAGGLTPLVSEAYQRLMAWKPTHENIWDNVF